MSTDAAVFWRRVFRLKGAWNCAICVVFFFAEDYFRAQLDAPATDPIYRALFLTLAFAFGLGYWWTADDPIRNRDIIRMGVVGQLFVFIILTYACFFAAQRLPWPFLVPGVVDLVFAIAFIVFLVRVRRAALLTTESSNT